MLRSYDRNALDNYWLFLCHIYGLDCLSLTDWGRVETANNCGSETYSKFSSIETGADLENI